MRKFLVVAALALLAHPAHAREVHEFKLGRHVVRVEIPSHCKRASCVEVYGRETSRGRKASEAASAPAASDTPTAAAAPTVVAPKVATAAKEPVRSVSQPAP